MCSLLSTPLNSRQNFPKSKHHPKNNNETEKTSERKRDALFLIALLVSTAKGGVYAHEATPGIDEAEEAWSYLDVAIPTPLSDMSVQILLAALAKTTTRRRQR
jgi:hypothetical protein